MLLYALKDAEYSKEVGIADTEQLYQPSNRSLGYKASKETYNLFVRGFLIRN